MIKDEYIKALAEKGITRRQLADKLNVPYNAMCHFLRGDGSSIFERDHSKAVREFFEEVQAAPVNHPACPSAEPASANEPVTVSPMDKVSMVLTDIQDTEDKANVDLAFVDNVAQAMVDAGEDALSE